VGLSGSVVAHPGGITLSPYAGDTVAVVSAPAAAGASVLGYPAVRLDASGNAVVPYLTPYRNNEVAIDPKNASPDLELKTTSQQVAPHAGSIIMLRYETVPGRAVLINTTLPGGAFAPFGADVLDDAGNNLGVVGQGGMIYAHVLADTGSLTVRWGGSAGESCHLTYKLPAAAHAADQGIPRINAVCVAGGVQPATKNLGPQAATAPTVQDAVPDVQPKIASQPAAPRAGSLHPVASGYFILIDAVLPDGAHLPVGSDIFDDAGNKIGAVGNGMTHARVSASAGSLTIRWGDSASQSCRFAYTLPATVSQGVPHIGGACVPGAAQNTLGSQ
jgi:outer membrane usher protein FimD/PapC